VTRIKICGVTDPANAAMAADAGADAIGLNFYSKSPRFVAPATAAAIVRALPPLTATVGVFVNEPLRRATALAFQLGLRAIQTVDDEPHTDDAFPFAHVVAFRVADRADVDRAAAFCQSQRPAAALIDARVPGQMGGTGKTVPWELLAGVDFGVPLILAGGLTPSNVAEAIRHVRPWAVDVASGVESKPGIKDPAMVRDFIQASRAASAAG
jgi:phosphoribosylanthranilate isomerase